MCTCDALRACGGSGGWEVGWGWATGKLACLLETGFSICSSAAMVLPAPGGARGDLCGAAVMSSEQERLERLERQERQERLAVQSRHVCPNASTHMTDQPLRPPCIHVYKCIHTYQGRRRQRPGAYVEARGCGEGAEALEGRDALVPLFQLELPRGGRDEVQQRMIHIGRLHRIVLHDSACMSCMHVSG